MANRLSGATSPYLLQHAGNPVHWWPWSEEAFAESRERDVPIFLSVGYAACHWCHVMARESFADPDTAEVLNAGFVAVKVDREERPDVDAVYMQATQALTGQGGWPMSVFLTPDGRPFYAGTYFPPRPRHGLPAFVQVLDAVREAWDGRRDEVVQSAAEISGRLAGAGLPGGGDALDADGCAAAVALLGREFDPTHAGFGRAPKFPPSMMLEALLRDGGPDATVMATRTLEAMARGGIYDQLGGGFARYSVDARWVVPHFEKMLYDNALLLGVYAHWWQVSGSPLAARVVGETVAWLLADLGTPEGGFAASLDADSDDAAGEHREGAYYVWTPAELVDALGAEEGAWAAGILSVTPVGTFEDGASTLQLASDPDQQRWRGVRARLRAARDHRARPARDDKVVAAWNGWLIEALTRAARLLERPDWLAAATGAAELVWRVHWTGTRLRRVSRDGVAGDAPGILEDYAALAHGFLRLAAAHGSAEWLERARTLLEVVEEQFGDGEDGLFDTASDAETLYTRPQDPTDNATPSGLSAAVHAMRLLAQLDADDRWDRRADTAADRAAALVRQAPRFAGWLLADAVSRTPGHVPAQVVIVGGTEEERGSLARIALRRAPAGSVVLAGGPDQPGLPLLAGRTALGGRATAYVCRHFVCRLPVTDAGALEAELGGQAA